MQASNGVFGQGQNLAGLACLQHQVMLETCWKASPIPNRQAVLMQQGVSLGSALQAGILLPLWHCQWSRFAEPLDQPTAEPTASSQISTVRGGHPNTNNPSSFHEENWAGSGGLHCASHAHWESKAVDLASFPHLLPFFRLCANCMASRRSRYFPKWFARRAIWVLNGQK